MNRTVFAFLIGPLAGPVLLIPYIRSLTTSPIWFVIALIVATVFTYSGVLIFGVPTYLVLRKRNWMALWIACALGAVIGMIMWLVFSAFFALVLDEGMWGVRLAFADPDTLKGVIWPGAAVGLVVGAALWLIGGPGRQDRRGQSS